MKSSQSVENYIKGIYGLSSDSDEWINTKNLAEKMNTKPSSVTDMVQKLDAKSLVSYKKYKGVQLTKKGQELALIVIRKHRLWEVFLQKKLGFSWDEVHDIAEQLEHISSPELVSRLDQYLNFPKFDPHGDPIPDADGKIKEGERFLISVCQTGDSGKLVGVADSSTSFLKFLETKELTLGIQIRIKEKQEYDLSVDIELVDQKKLLNISNEVASNLFLAKA